MERINSIDKGNRLYQSFFEAFKLANKTKYPTWLTLQNAANAAYKTVPVGKLEDAVKDLKAEAALRVAQNKAHFMSMFRPKTTQSDVVVPKSGSIGTAAAVDVQQDTASSSRSLSVGNPPLQQPSSSVPDSVELSSEDESLEVADTDPTEETEGPRQKQILTELEETNCEIASLSARRSIRLLTSAEEKLNSQLVKKKMELQKRLEKVKRHAEASRKCRAKKKLKCADEVETGPKVRKVGRPTIETEQPGLQEAILQIVDGLAGADGRRRTEKLEVCATLSDLHKKILNAGFELSKTSLYYRLLPRRQDTREGDRHKHTVPVKLLRPQNSQRKSHPDGHFATATIKHLKELAVLFGPDVCLFLSQDDKARVPIGLAAANKQSCLLMNLQYRVTLPDHDWVVAQRHKLIPSVYAACEVAEEKVKVHGGPTYIAIRSGKHDSSTAVTHATDFKRLMTLESFADFAKMGNGDLKPIVFCSVDGGPDENPRFPKTLAAWSEHFKAYNLDAVFVATHAPGQSALNAVERRMAPLSYALAGVILPHDAYGSHLDNQGRTTDTELEKRNFEKAGNTLAEIWRQKDIDGCPVEAEFVAPAPSGDLSYPDERWISVHVRQSQYLLQIVRCNDRLCCAEWRSNYNVILPERFLPPPARFVRTVVGVELAPVERDVGNFGSLQQRLMLDGIVKQDYRLRWRHAMPFDAFCPSVQESMSSRICSKCNAYFPTTAAVNRHKRAKACLDHIELRDGFDSDVESDSDENDTEEYNNLEDASEDECENDVMPVRNVFDEYMVQWDYE